MKVLLLFISLYFSFSLQAQYSYNLSQPVPNNAQLLSLNDHVVLIHAMDINNKTHKWVTLDSTLKEVAAKKLSTPDADYIINQIYLESINSIIRIDQLLIDEELYLNAYLFDIKGNLIQNKEIVIDSAQRVNLTSAPFHIVQSNDKAFLSLIQAHLLKGDNLSVFNIVLDQQLNLISNSLNTLPYREELDELQMPLINNKGTVFIPIADKFDSYKLGSVLTCHLLPAGNKNAKKVQIEFGRSKVKDLQLNASGDTLYFSAFYSKKEKKDEVAGLLHAGYDIRADKYILNKTYSYSAEVKDELKKIFGSEKRKGHLLNYLSQLPMDFNHNLNYNYAILLPPEQVKINNPPPKSAPEMPASMGELRQRMGNIEALVGTQPNGYNKPLSYIEASTYAATMQNGNAPYVPNSDNYYKVNHRTKKYIQHKSTFQQKNLLFFSLQEMNNNASQKFIKIKQLANPAYNYFQYLPLNNGYNALYYTLSSTGEAYLQATSIDLSGQLAEKKIYDHRSNVLLSGYDFILDKGKLISFYEDKMTGRMGLLKLDL